MRKLESHLISDEATIRDAVGTIDASAYKIALVVNQDRKLLATVTDGDIRRGILRGLSLEDRITEVMNTDPVTARTNQEREQLFDLMRSKGLRHIPVLNEDRRLVGVESLREILYSRRKDQSVLLMAGGWGKRLKPLTESCPKPMIRVGDKPILETIIDTFIKYGFQRFYISVNYKAEMITSYFGDGTKKGAEIHYLIEDRPMGTAGPIGLLPKQHDHPIIVMNGDILTRLNFEHLLEFHEEHNARATICVREYQLQVPFGTVRAEQYQLTHITEKPVYSFLVNAGIYILEPNAVALVRRDEPLDMPDLFAQLLEMKESVAVFPIHEYWMDVGRVEDLHVAQTDYSEIFI